MKLRKVLSLLVAFVMMVQVLPLASFATKIEDATENVEVSAEAVEEETETEEVEETVEDEAVDESESDDSELISDVEDEEETVEKVVEGEETVLLGASDDESGIATVSDDEEVTVVDSGSCGTNVTWVLDSDGVLTISGTGKMNDYLSASSVPWYSSRSIIKSVVIEYGVTSISSHAFYQCTELTSVNISDSVTIIRSAFRYCTSLVSITIPDSVISISGSSFTNCSSLVSIEVSSNNASYLSLDGILFSKDMSELVRYPEGKSNIYPTYIIPDTVINIGKYAFFDCVGLTSVTIPDSVTSIGNLAFSNCTGLTNIIIPGNVKSTGYSAFTGCAGLTGVTISDGVTCIDEFAFEYCTSLTSLTIPNSVTSIDTRAFHSCKNLSDVYYGGTISEWNSITIDSYNDPLLSATIHCTDGVISGDGTVETGLRLETSYGRTTYLPTEDGVYIDIIFASEEEQVNCTLSNDSVLEIGTMGSNYIVLNIIGSGSVEVICETSDGDSASVTIDVIDIFNFLNSSTDFFASGNSEYYYITESDYARLISNLTRTDIKKIEDELCIIGSSSSNSTKWTGSCRGLSVWAVLVAKDVLSASSTLDSETLYEATKPSEDVTNLNASAINFYHVQQYLDNYVFVKDVFMKTEQEEQIKALLSSIDEEPTLISYQWRDGIKTKSHAVVAFDYYVVDDTVNGIENPIAVLIYDSRYQQPQTMYIDTQTYWWYYEDLISSDNGISFTDSNNKARLKYVGNSTDILNIVDYSSGNISASLKAIHEAKYTLLNGAYDFLVSLFDASSVITYDSLTTTVVEGTDIATVVLSDSESVDYTATIEDEAIALTLETANYYTAVSSDSSGTVTLYADGGADLSLDSEEEYAISITANDGYTSLPWYTLDVTGEGETDISAVLTDEYLVIEGTDLSDITVYGTNDYETVELTFSTDKEKALVTEDSAENMIVLIDEDNNGTYETVIATTDYAGLVEEAKTTLSSTDWTLTQSDVESATGSTTADKISTLIDSILAGLGIDDSVTVTYTITDITEAIAGDATDTDGTDGSFTINFTISVGNESDTLTETGTITATAYTDSFAGDQPSTPSTPSTPTTPTHTHTTETVIENYVAATATTDGSYDSVTYCTECGEIISESHTVIAAYGSGTGETIDWATALTDSIVTVDEDDSGITTEDVVIEEPIEPTDTETEDDGEEPTAEPAVEEEAPAETNPTTGIVISLIPMAIAALAAVSSKRR